MRTSRTAILSCAALLGLGTLIGQATPAAAGPTPPMVIDQNGGGTQQVGQFDLTTPTTKPDPHPGPDAQEMDLVLPQDEPDFEPPLAVPSDHDVVIDPSGNDDGECTPGTVPDPDCQPDDEPCVPDSTVPGTPDEQCPQDDCDPQRDLCTDDCLPIPGGPDADCDDPCEERPTGSTAAQIPPRPEDCDDPECPEIIVLNAQAQPLDEPGRDDPCDDPECPLPGGDDIARSRAEDCDDPKCPTPDTRPERRHVDDPSREDCDDPKCVPADDEDQHCNRGRLPRTGGDLLAYGAAGLGLTGIGAVLKRLGRSKA